MAPLRAIVSIPPQAYFVERVGGAHVAVEVLAGPGQSPHAYEPTARQIASLRKAQVYFRIGAEFEKGLLRKVMAVNGTMAIVDTREGIALRASGNAGGMPDPHIWLDPKRAKVQAATIAGALCRLQPGGRETFQENLRAFQDDLDRVDRKIADLLAPFRGGVFYVFHPAFGYFGDSYGLTQAAVETGGKEPSPKQLAALINRARREGVRIIFVQPQYPRHNAEAVARAVGGAVAPLDPLARDYLNNLEVMAETLRQGLAQGTR